MSAVIKIYKVAKDIDLSQFKTWKDLDEFEEKNKYEKEYIDREGNLSSYMENKYEFEPFMSYISYKHNSTRLKKQIRAIQDKYKDYFVSVRSSIGMDEEHNLIYDENRGDICRYLITEQLLYRQGWFFKKRFFNNYWPIYYATTRQHMIRLLDQFINVNPKAKDRRGLEAYRACLDTFKDNEDMIFEMSW